MATTAPTVSAWAKPGAWALDSEEHEEDLIQQEKNERENGHHLNYQSSKQTQQQQLQPLADFPTLSTALSTKQPKKKKGSTTLSLSEFTTGKSVTHGSATLYKANKGLTTDELLVLPTGPRERSAEELERGSRLGGGFRSYGDGGGQGRGREDSSSRWGSERGSGGAGGGGFSRDRENTRDSGPSRADETDDWGAAKRSSMGAPSFERRERDRDRDTTRDSGPSRADEADDWGAGKKSSMGVPSFERRERGVGGGGGGGFFDSQSRADESDSWVSNKSRAAAAPVPRRVGGGGGGFENRERRGGFEFQKETLNGGGADSDTWGKKREDGPLTAARTRLVLQPKTLSPSNGEQELESTVKTKGSNPFGEARPREEVLAEKGQDWKAIDEKLEEVKIKEDGLTIPVLDDGSSLKVKRSSNPFGEARPREEVLAEKGQDWKKIDEQLESAKIKENGLTGPVPEDGKKVFSNGNGRVSSPEGRTERSWRKTEVVDVAPETEVVDVAPPPSAEIANEDGGAVAEN